jgi:putative ABC transport system substrate-binding protein
LSKLRQLGWNENRNLVVERAYAAGQVDRLPELAAELVRKRVDVIWANGAEAALAAAGATKTIPIVFWGVVFPVEQGLIDSLPRPGRNVTGIAWATGIEVAVKQLEFIREIAPHTRRLSTFSMPTVLRTAAGGDYTQKMREVVESATRGMGFEVQRNILTQREDFEAAFAAILAFRAEAVLIAAHPLTFRDMPRIVEFLNGNRLISAFGSKAFVQGGGLLSYGPDFFANIAATSVYVDKIFRGAKPADLPVELPSRYELAVNLKTAALLGLKIPGTVLVRAEHIIE